MNFYTEPEDAGYAHRAEVLSQFKALLGKERRKADARRKQYFRPDLSSIEAYRESIVPYRQEFKEMLGWPLTEDYPGKKPKVRRKFVAEDDQARITRLWIEMFPGVETYGILFMPPGDGPHPLIISQHGGGGTPEYCSSFHTSWNYNDMTRRILKRGFAVFAPQLMLWAEYLGPKCDFNALDRELKTFGGSMAACEILRLQRCLDYLLSRQDIDENRVGMIGLSWGSFYTMVTAAVDTRIRSALASCFFNSHAFSGAMGGSNVWFNSANLFLGAEIAGLICPRRLCIEIGTQEKGAFSPRLAQKQLRTVEKFYGDLGIPGEFMYNEHDWGHEVDRKDEAIRFLIKGLKKL